MNKDGFKMEVKLNRLMCQIGDTIQVDFRVDNKKGDGTVNNVKWKLVLYLTLKCRNKSIGHSLRKRITKVKFG